MGGLADIDDDDDVVVDDLPTTTTTTDGNTDGEEKNDNNNNNDNVSMGEVEGLEDNQEEYDYYYCEDDEQVACTLLSCCCTCLVGVCCVVLSPILCCCCATVAAANAVDTAVQKSQGKRWDAKQQEWVIDNLKEDEEYLRELPDDDDDILKLNKKDDDDEDNNDKDKQNGNNDTKTSKKAVKETTYYDVLGVPVDADESKIKRAYYVNARKWHPDRNAGCDDVEKEANKTKFQKIGEAYQVLSDTKLRKVYDLEGEAGLSGDRTEISTEAVDPSLVFTFLFGSDVFTSIIGRLNLVTLTLLTGEEETEDDDENEKDEEVIAYQIYEIEKRRVIRLALALVERIQTYVDIKMCNADEQLVNQEEVFAINEWKNDAKELVEASYGEAILNLVGSTYKLVAIQYIGKQKKKRKKKKAGKNEQTNAEHNHDGGDHHHHDRKEAKKAKKELENMRHDAAKAIDDNNNEGTDHNVTTKTDESEEENDEEEEVNDGNNNKEGKEEEEHDTDADADADGGIPEYIGVMWNVTVIDISLTLHEVVMKVLCDVSVTEDVRYQRAIAIKKLGEIYESTKSSNQKGSGSSSKASLYQKAAQAAMEQTIKKAEEQEQQQQQEEEEAQQQEER